MKRFMILACVVAAALALASSWAIAQDGDAPSTDWPGQIDDWYGYELHDFTFDGRNAKVVFPKEQAPGKPWIWRARFFGHEPQFDCAMLQRGYTLAYIDSAPLMGSPKSVALWQKYYLWLRAELGLAQTANLEGMSRGGLYTTNWAFQYPDEVATIYIDNPVLDFKSWPGGFMKGQRSDSDWSDVLKSYELTEEEALAYKLNPKDNKKGCQKLADHGVGIFLVCGDADDAVPGDENWKPFKELYESCGGTVELILKPGMGHHPHSLPDPTPIVEFVLKHDKTIEEAQKTESDN